MLKDISASEPAQDDEDTGLKTPVYWKILIYLMMITLISIVVTQYWSGKIHIIIFIILLYYNCLIEYIYQVITLMLKLVVCHFILCIYCLPGKFLFRLQSKKNSKLKLRFSMSTCSIMNKWCFMVIQCSLCSNKTDCMGNVKLF